MKYLALLVLSLLTSDKPFATLDQNLTWEWRQTDEGKHGNLFEEIVKTSIDPFKVTAPPKVNAIAAGLAAYYMGEIYMPMLAALRIYVFNPGGDPLRVVYERQPAPDARQQYQNYVAAHGEAAFWHFIVSVNTLTPHNLEDCRKNIQWNNAENQQGVTDACDAFNKGDDVRAMFFLMYGQRHAPTVCETYRATYRDQRAELVAVINNWVKNKR